ncbi:multicopper oxidase domain-containing protein [Kitasatospora sp. NBC_00240]|uniref:multicopper oxidase domain-containing protein n=1 Tax=Kitasatospora sp. NBC_00240 TaxID=2903567 RepID=UPI002256E416|nr:multicopper oxidase domain-containing protein [Kitasatospora sp. NBC_00240]MCX5209404.1 multicopper oxidase domain-containing protein [Kitasatospora sp. NBC_00240]
MREENREPGRRSMIRGLVGGGTVAALAGPAALLPPRVARADAPAAPGGDPFALPKFEPNGRVREFWIQAESFEHNAVPNGTDAMMGRPFTPEQTTFWALGYRAYTAGWESPLDPDLGPDGIGANSGIPGPVLRAEAGDVLRVHFRNNDEHYRWPHSMHPHGVMYDRDNDGGWLADDEKRAGSAVPYGESFTYTWYCHPSSVGTWPYHDHSLPQTPPGADPSAGAAADAAARARASRSQPRQSGPEQEGDRQREGAAGPDGAAGHPGAATHQEQPRHPGGGDPGDHDGAQHPGHEGGQDGGQQGGEDGTPGGGAGDAQHPGHQGGQDDGHGTGQDDGTAAGQNDGHGSMVMEIGAELGLFGILVVTDQQTPSVDREFVIFLHDLNRRSARSLGQGLNMFNGRAFVDNTPTCTAKVGDRVRWRIACLGEEFHVFHIHGHRWRSRQGYQGWVDSQIIGPSTTLTIEYTEDNPGDWIYHCHVTHHMTGGMVGRYLVTP